MEKISALFKKYKEVILYLVFGGATTAVNIVCYFLLYNVFSVSNVISTIISQIVAIVFAFVTNKIYVFESKTNTRKEAAKEMVSFFFFRFLTGVLDLSIMYIAVDRLGMWGMLWKVISNIIVIILNYIASKLVVFKKGKESKI